MQERSNSSGKYYKNEENVCRSDSVSKKNHDDKSYNIPVAGKLNTNKNAFQ